MARILHLLPHPGQGGERYVERLKAGLDEYDHVVRTLGPSPSPLRAAPALIFKRPFLAYDAKNAGVTHVHGDMTAILSRQIVRGLPVVFTTHGLHFLRRATGRRRRFAERNLREVVRTARATLCTSQAEMDELQALVQGGGRLTLARNGVPDRPAPTAQERSAARAELGLPPDAVVGLFLGELSDRKDPLGAIAAARDAGIELLVAGDGPLRGRVEAEQDETTRVLGQRDDPERLIAAADLFVLPSSREGLSLALLEAMAAGRPPVVADGPGNPEAVGEAGIVVPAGDTAALTQALARLRDDPAERERLGGKARERVRTEFSEQRLFDAVRAAYENALA